MTYEAMDIARYVINYSIDIERPVSNLKLQKILYYIQATFLVEKGEPCFEDPISRWRHGPVQEDVYHNYKKYFGRDIWEKQIEYKDIVFGENSIMEIIKKEFKNEIIEEIDRGKIDKVIESYKDIDAWDLVYKTHLEEPWIATAANKTISNKLIKKYFSENEGQIYGE